MVFLKTALLNLKKNIMMNFLVIVEMTSAIIIFMIMISSLLIRYTYYEPFSTVLNKKGIFYSSTGASTYELDDSYFSDDTIELKNRNFLHDDEILPFLHTTDRIIACNIFGGGYAGSSDEIKSFSYNDELIKLYSPQLAEGRWLNTSDKAEKVEVVVSDNNYNWKVGDIIEISSFYDNGTDFGQHTFDAEIVGILKDGEKIFGIESSIGDEDFNMLYSTYDFEYQETPLLLFSSDYFYAHEETSSLFNKLWFALIQYPDETSQEILEQDSVMLSKLGSNAIRITFDVINKNSMDYLFSQFFDMLPIISIILILIITSSISSTAITTRGRLRDYSIYCITGLQWKHCTLINLIQSALTSVFALLLSAAAIGIIQLTPLADTVTIIPHLWTFSAVAALILLYILISMIMPAIIIGKSTPKEILAK